MSDRPAPEIVVGLVGAVGTPLDTVADQLERSLARVGYKSLKITLSKLLRDIKKYRDMIDETSEATRIATSMTAGTDFRTTLDRGDALAGLAVGEIRKLRGGDSPRDEHCYILRSLKNPKEVEALRTVYRDHFVLVGVYSPRHVRVARLAEAIAQSVGKRSDEFRAKAEELIARDEKESGTSLGQNVRNTFPMSDVFIAGTSIPEIEQGADRFVDIFFGRPFITPTREEDGMFHASAAAMRSAALGRQVGAAIATRDGDLVSVGVNEVPKAGGGHYWCGDEGDARDFARGFDQNDLIKRSVLREVLRELQQQKWLAATLQAQSVESLVDSVLSGAKDSPALRDAFIMSLTEFGRDVHAEMSAIVSAARRGTSIAGCTLYATTFPCHNCAKHIVDAGISTVVYVEPYPKSFAREFYPDSILVEGEKETRGKVLFLPFSGVSPRRYMDWFHAGTRKYANGKVVSWIPTSAFPVFAAPQLGGMEIAYPLREESFAVKITKAMVEKGLVTSGADVRGA
ncbi:MAG: anti-phage dCTP deaminase [Myxococcaceae bacterium]